MGTESYDHCYRRGECITFVLKHKPFIDLSIPPSSNDYRDASCVNVAVYGTSLKEQKLGGGVMSKVPNRPGWYFYRYQTTPEMLAGVYTAIFTTITTIDGKDYTSRNIQEFRLLDDGIL